MNTLFGEWLKKELDNKKITQSELAQMIGVHPPQVSRIISGERSTTNETLIAIAHALKISPITLFRKAGLLPDSNGADIKLDDWEFLLKHIAEELTRRGIPSPSRKSDHWHVESVRHILLNPFYAGIVAIGQKRPERTSKKGIKYRQRMPHSAWKQGRGLHQPLWDETTLLAIENEFARRLTLKNYAKVTYPLAGLIRCTVCQQKLIRRKLSRGGILLTGLGCKQGATHITITYAEAIQLLADTLKKELHNLHLNPPSYAAQTERLQQELTQLQEERTTVQVGYETKIYNAEEASQKIGALERQIQTKQDRLAQLEHAQQTHTEQRQLHHSLQEIKDLGNWMQHDDPAIVNHILSTLCQTIWLTPDHTLTITWRE